MADFNEAIAAQLAGNTVRVSPLVEFRFASGTVRVWPGFGPLVTTDGQTWTGIGNLGRLSILEAGPGQAASERTYSLFGDETTLANIAADADATMSPVPPTFAVAAVSTPAFKRRA